MFGKPVEKVVDNKPVVINNNKVAAPVRVKKVVAEEVDERATTLDINDKGLIELCDEDIMELLSYFEPTHDNLSGVVANLYHSPFDKDDVLRCLLLNIIIMIL